MNKKLNQTLNNTVHFVILLTLFAFASLYNTALAGYTWDGLAESTDWYGTKLIPDSNPPEYISNWGTTGNPPPIPNSETDDVTISGGWTVKLPRETSIRDMVIGTSDHLKILSILTTYGNSIVNAGTIEIGYTSVVPDTLSLHHTNTVLSGGGTVILSDAPITGHDGDERLTNVDNTIQGRGTLGGTNPDDRLALTNHGTITATPSPSVSSSGLINIRPNDGGVINTGTMQASDGDLLQLYDGTYTNTGGIIQALDGGEVSLSGATVIEGTLTSSGTGIIECGNVTLQNVTNSGRITAINTILSSGTFTNNGEFTVKTQPALTTSLKIDGTVTITGTGSVILISWNAIETTGSGTLINNMDHTISGSGLLGNNNMELTNYGTIKATGSGDSLDTELFGTAGMINEGFMQAVSTGGFRFCYIDDETFTNASTVEILSDSQIELDYNKTYLQTAGSTLIEENGTLDARYVELQGGELVGSGLIKGKLTVTGGTLSPGLSVGELTVRYGLLFKDGGTLNVEIADANNADSIQVGQYGYVDYDATFEGGYIDVTLLDSYAPSPGESWTIMSADTLAGVENLSVQEGYWLSVNNGTDLVLHFSELPGDCDRDGDVDLLDFSILSENWQELLGMTWDDGDFDNNGTVDLSDLLIQTEHWLIGVE